MSLEYQMKHGLLYCEYGHKAEEDKAYEKVMEKQREKGKELMFEYNNQTAPSNYKRKKEILTELLGGVGESVWIEAPAHFSYGCNTYIGNHFYSNFNMVIVDDAEVHIGDYVMLGPNVTISVTGHPVYGEYRRNGTQFSLPVHIGNDVWIGANVVILPGVTIGDDVVIGAGSVVTKDIPSHSVAVGVPCRVLREITEYDREYFRKDCPVNHGWAE
ncbi:MAG: sugar O-acetyltransferase [bacterium]|nr:sugar O-acetyltransferase [bacterium]